MDCENDAGFIYARALTSAVQATFAAWVRWDTLDDSTVVFAFGNNLESTGVSRAGMTDAIRFWVGANTVEGGAIATGAWSHVVGVVDPQGMRLYLDGVPIGDDPSYTDPMFPSPGTSYFLGRSTNPDPRYLNGALDDVRIYSRALDSTEVVALYHSGFYDHRTSEDWDGDGVLNDGDGSGDIGDQPCAEGTTSSCDDNAVMCPNPGQRQTSCYCYMSCADVGTTVDGLYTIDPDGAGGNPAFEVYCADMATAEPKEYLELVVTGGMNNYSYYVYTSGGTAATCNYDKVRFDDIFVPRIDRWDQRFATCTGNASYFGSARWGEASSCMCGGCSNGTMNIDLTGTPFKIDYAGGAGWETVGFIPGGSITRDDGPGIIVEATGGGYCGSTRPIVPPGLILTFQ